MRSEHSQRSSSRRRKLRKTKSAENLGINSADRKSSKRANLRKPKRVQFLCDEKGQIQSEERKFKIYLDRSLWWNRRELQAVEDECVEIVLHAQKTGQTNLELPQYRGLETYIDEARDRCVIEHRQLVLGASKGVNSCDEAINEAILKVSRDAMRLARRTAMSDTMEALRAALT